MGVLEGVRELVGVCVGVRVTEAVMMLLSLAWALMLGVGVEKREGEAGEVAEGVCVERREGVGMPVVRALAVPVLQAVEVGVEGVEGEAMPEPVEEGVSMDVGLVEEVEEADQVGSREGVGAAEPVEWGVALVLEDCVGQGEEEWEWEGVALELEEESAEGVGASEAGVEMVEQGDCVEALEGEEVREALVEAEEVSEMAAVRVALGVKPREGDCVVEGD